MWEIAGGDAGYFKATDYSVRQIANTGAVNAASIIIAEGVPFFWGEGAIYSIQRDPDRGFLFVQDISTGKIQKLILELSKAAKAQVQVAYDRSTKKVYWLYDAASETTWQYSTWLVMDLRLSGAFSKFRNYSTTYSIRSIYDIEDYQPEGYDQRNVKFMCVSNDRNTLNISELRDTSWEDYAVDAPAFVETGWGALGPPDRRKYGRYLFAFMKRTETGYTDVDQDWVPTDPSRCKVRYIWNWADTSNTGKWSNQQGAYNQQAYKYRRPWLPSTSTDIKGESVVVSKLKVRGSGKVLMLRYDTEAGYNCHLYGWHIRQDVNREA